MAAFRERISAADRGHHRARDDRPDARHAHQPRTALVLPGQRFDFAGQTLDALIQSVPVSHQVLYDAQNARREHIGARRQDARQLGPQETQPLPYRDAALQQKGADLIDDAGALTDQSLAHAVHRLQVELLNGLDSIYDP